jgi:hypothetical protein
VPELPDAGRRPSGRLAGLLLVAVLLGAAPSARCAAGGDDLAAARDLFLIADYAAALDRITAVLRAGTAGPADRLAALELEARCQVALGRGTEAIDSFCSGLRQAPAWRPELAEFTEAERDAFSRAFELCGPLDAPAPPAGPVSAVGPETAPRPGVEARPAEAPARPAAGRPWYRSPWFLGGVGGVLAGVAYLSLGGEESPPPAPFPDFPPPPE